ARARFHRSVDVARLRSFPTRRSSDLADEGAGDLVDGGLAVDALAGAQRLLDQRVEMGPDVAARLGAGEGGAQLTEDLGLPHRHRSEEHTSELQSRFDLVCRLLLEKKK